jgi:hypothetical protein
MSNFMKIHLLGTHLVPAGRQIDRQKDGQTVGRTGLMKLIFTFRNLRKRPKNLTFLSDATQ